MLSPDIRELVDIVVDAARDKKAFQLVTLDVTEMTSIADSFIICSGSSDRQVDAIADSVITRLRERGRRPLHVEGSGLSGWILVDYGDLVAHVFNEDKRSYYALDNLWSGADRIEAGTPGPDAAAAGADRP
jgi:ribosome-associated protein